MKVREERMKIEKTRREGKEAERKERKILSQIYGR